jgi:regulatory protein
MTPIKTENETPVHLALKYLKYRPRSRAEIRNYLQGKSFSDKTILLTIQRLESAGLIDDGEFARLWVENRRRFRPKGRFGLKVELKQKGIEDAIIDSALKTEDEEKNAWSAVQSKMMRWQQYDNEELKKKVVGFLRSRGFSFKTCMEMYDRIINGAAITE